MRCDSSRQVRGLKRRTDAEAQTQNAEAPSSGVSTF
jgi:hypothetical protein